MPRLDLPQKQVRSAGSTGVQPDIDISSPQFRAISKLGASVEGLADQSFDIKVRAQRHVDQGATAAYAADNSVFENQLSLDLDAEGVANDKKAQDQLTADSFNTRREALASDLNKRGVSDARQREIFDDFEAKEKNFNIGLQAKQLKQDVDLANSDKSRAARDLFRAGDLDAGNALIQSMEATDQTKNELSDKYFQDFKKARADSYSLQIRAATTLEESNDAVTNVENDEFLTDAEKEPLVFVGKKQNISLHNAIDKDWLDATTETINNSFSIDALEALKAPDGTQQKTINSFNTKRSAKVKALKIEKSTENLQAIDLLRKGQLLTDDLDSFNLDTTERVFFENLIDKRTQGLGKEAIEFSEAAGRIKTWGFSGGGFFFAGREADVSEKDAIWGEINSGKYNSNAQLLLGSLMIEAEGLDAKDGEIDVAASWLDFDLSEQGGIAFGDVSKDMLTRMGGVVGGLPATEEGKLFAGEDIDRLGFSRARVDPEDAWTSWQEIRALAEVHLREGSENIEEFRRLSKVSIDKATTSSELTKLFNKRTEAAKTKRTRGTQ